MPVQHVEEKERGARRVEAFGRVHSSLVFFEKS